MAVILFLAELEKRTREGNDLWLEMKESGVLEKDSFNFWTDE